MSIKVIDIKNNLISEEKSKFNTVLPIEDLSNYLYLLNKYQKNIQRTGTSKAKSRSEIRGGGAKPYSQKGTGRARRGTSRTPLRPGGGVIFGPQVRSYRTSLNKKYIKQVLMTYFKSIQDKLVVLQLDKIDNYKTKDFNILFKDVVKPVLIVCDKDVEVQKKCKNISKLHIVSASTFTVDRLENADKIFMTKDGYEYLIKRVKL